jgi:hypothetical protein
MMRIRASIAFMIAGFVAKGSLLLLWKLERLQPVIFSLINLDGTAWLALKTCDLLFAAPHHEVAAAKEYLVFNSTLVLGTGIEFLCVSFVVQTFWNWLKPAESEPAPNAAQVP